MAYLNIKSLAAARGQASPVPSPCTYGGAVFYMEDYLTVKTGESCGTPGMRPVPRIIMTWTSPLTWTSWASSVGFPLTVGSTQFPPSQPGQACMGPGLQPSKAVLGFPFLPSISGSFRGLGWEGHTVTVFHNLCFYMVAFIPVDPQQGEKNKKVFRETLKNGKKF